jgi:transposase
MEIVSSRVRNLGLFTLLKPILDRLQIAETMDRYLPMRSRWDLGVSHGRVLEMLVLNRLMSPKPLYRIQSWAEQLFTEAFGPVTASKLYDNRIGRALNVLHPHIEAIEAEIVCQAITEFQVSTDIVHYDPTSIYFEGEYPAEELLKLGYSRDCRPDAKQIHLGLNVTHDGSIPIRHTIRAGNTTDVTTVDDNMQKLRQVVKSQKLLIISDRGTVSAKNLIALSKGNAEFLCTLSLKEPHKALLSKIPEYLYTPIPFTPKRKSKKSVGQFWGVERSLEFHWEKEKITARALLVKSSIKLEVDRKGREKRIQALEKRLRELRAKLNKRQYRKKRYVKERLNTILKKSRSVKYLTISLRGETDKLSLFVWRNQRCIREEQKLDGKYIMVTNLRDKTAPELLRLYKDQSFIEWRIRTLKRHLKVRPVFLHREERIKGLVFITMLALMVYSLLERFARRSGLALTARTLSEHFQDVRVIEHRLSDKKKTLLRTLEDLNPIQNRILKKLGLKHPRFWLFKEQRTFP